ncbi:MAG: hypothetical protein JSR95_08930 [Proteobacteria bacterium]|nr:hypothetical protein [Pseudomonadota bacterium]
MAKHPLGYLLLSLAMALLANPLSAAPATLAQVLEGAPPTAWRAPDPRRMIQRVRVEADVPVAEREHLEVLRTDTPTFDGLVESRRNRRENWYVHPAGRIELCNVPIPVREVSGALTAP